MHLQLTENEQRSSICKNTDKKKKAEKSHDDNSVCLRGIVEISRGGHTALRFSVHWSD